MKGLFLNDPNFQVEHLFQSHLSEISATLNLTTIATLDAYQSLLDPYTFDMIVVGNYQLAKTVLKDHSKNSP